MKWKCRSRYLSPFRRIKFRPQSVVLCVLLISALIPAFSVIGKVIVTDEGLYTRQENGRPFNRIGSEPISIHRTGNILTELHVFLVADYLIYVEHHTMIDRHFPVRTTMEDGITVIASGILIAPTAIAYQCQEPADRQHSEGCPPTTIKITEYVCMPPSGRLRVIHV